MRANLSKDLLRISRKAHLCAGKIVEKYHLSLAEEPFLWQSPIMMEPRRRN